MNRKHSIAQISRWIAMIGLLVAPTMVSAQQKFENLDRLDSLVSTTVGANIGEPGGPAARIDRRLHLKPCPSTPEITGPTFGAAIVTCKEIGWRIRVPLVPANVAQSPARTMNAQPAPEKPVIVIRKGDPVELVAGTAMFSVSRQMIADEDGAVGQSIRVRQNRRSEPISARVESAGVVRAPGI